MKLKKIELPLIRVYYFKRYFTGHFIRCWIEKWFIGFGAGWNPYRDSRMIEIHIGYAWSDYMGKKLDRLIKKNPDKMKNILNVFNQLKEKKP